MTILRWPETECLDLYFHTKRAVCVQGASLIAEKRMHADSLFPCRMKTAMESDSKAFSPGRSIRQLAIKKKKKVKRKSSLIMFASLCATNKQMQHSLKLTQLLQMSTIYLLNNWYELLREFFKGGYICLLEKANLSHRNL